VLFVHNMILDRTLSDQFPVRVCCARHQAVCACLVSPSYIMLNTRGGMINFICDICMYGILFICVVLRFMNIVTLDTYVSAMSYPEASQVEYGIRYSRIRAVCHQEYVNNICIHNSRRLPFVYLGCSIRRKTVESVRGGRSLRRIVRT